MEDVETGSGAAKHVANGHAPDFWAHPLRTALDAGPAQSLDMRELALLLPAGRERRWTLNGDFLGLRPTGVAR